MKKKADAPWRKMRRAATVFSVFAVLALIVGVVSTFLTAINSHGSVDYEDFWLTYVSLVAFFGFVIISSALRNSSDLLAYSEILKNERRVAVIAQIVGENPAMTKAKIIRLIRQGKLDARFVDTEKGVVVVTQDEGDSRLRQPSANETPPIAEERPAIVRAVCTGCGAMMDIPYGQTMVCEYCGAAVYGVVRKEQVT